MTRYVDGADVRRGAGRGVLVHEWIAARGGSENVFDRMVEVFPDADLLCLWSDRPGGYPGRRLRETWLGRTPLRRSKPAALPFMPIAWRNVPVDRSYRWALVSSHLFAHHVSFAGDGPDVRKLVYVHSPARYIWEPSIDSRGQNLAARTLAPALRRLDRRRAGEAESIASNSRFVQQRVRRAWGRDSRVIHPPVEVARIQREPWATRLTDVEAALLDGLPEEFVLGASRFVPYKRLDRAVDVGEAAGLPVVLAGGGPERDRLRQRADASSVPVVILEDPSDALLYTLYGRAAVYVFLAVEDFGIMPVEAMAAGVPVLGLDVGGTSETVVEGVSGAVVGSGAGPSELRAALTRAREVSSESCRAHARRFGTERFEAEIAAWVEEVVGGGDDVAS